MSAISQSETGCIEELKNIRSMINRYLLLNGLNYLIDFILMFFVYIVQEKIWVLTFVIILER
ncbi:hypothetical protein XBFFL1_2530015 [Xenorhabdus bovienii str. feltiae Florida]|uniref:Uncharacterized protein n=4 Tax=Xenorhabdus bovienii TaxID=40576 RepID=A0A077QMD0_XENBV|nr:hypothetical protein XBFFR1_2480014 [Xenorhabdus bovienii str. feltiae France]CDG93437.1 hypothetical protein XBFFL1_2530015 [Xenorhabdus bovienii str. feltiae Florida]CDH01673.1 hypothetical protein XBFM1_2280006 [Xenorhabdus bovienii str. feltiae Moldova]CDH23763.1 hypothetical protein XBKB1_2020004 [Xenorhabdus bovienii str. kraussei Becker Underwood]CDH34689.1 hypothetical protein XBI1_400059 [Xenorhabdus bovienii str. Intermedium]CDM90083.1 conserved protein of unknown function [Xenorh